MTQIPFQRFALMAEGLACRRGGRAIFDGVGFLLENGTAIALTGRNGAGKSSLIAMLSGRLRPEAGAIKLDGLDDTPLAEAAHLVGHRDGLKTALTAAENLRFAQDLLGQPGLTPTEALATVGLPHAGPLPVGYLSAGQRRRVALARLLVAARPIWLLDEPMAALDTSSQAMLSQLMQAHLAAGGAILAATHGPLGLEGARELRIGP
ncbi:heme exporter subunit; ATP-binding component of ABC superfamily [Bosea sp. 62]|nr:heme exporter subunit; ATP-binding component of ABC superfamily [Bosea sp. 7B]CAD5282819.1 heme exporter subunit; ATP-binding component of ABC superfamily [Bosea sp. 21B]CAD5285480.1 heme exporter subunit; ATP-binding component of ABC superfamily [Bosea sp. 46]VVT62290.1 heme exporter subunit; ATP-binding component of ABC superfamily [Bosea sp. EC-HK365B]VXB20304.1 heme exporter subunit; ATP-binding component of ABC superfamily [Bosea sp. 62]VXB81354.1 heme exporter subunit; ATP-binding com